MDTAAAAAAAAAGCFGLGHVFFNEPNPFSKPKVKKKQTTNKTEKDSNPKEGRKKEGREGSSSKGGRNFLGLRREVLALKKAFLG